MKNKIKMFVHCAKCLDEVENIEGESPSSYSDYDFGYTETGIQLWCNRHDTHILTKDLPPSLRIDFDTCECASCKQKIKERFRDMLIEGVA